MLSFQNQCLVRFSRLLILVLATNQAISVQIAKDTLAERLLKEGQYKLASENVAAQLKDRGKDISPDNRLYLFTMLSMAQFRMNNFDSAMVCARQALKLSAGSKDSTLIGEAWKMMSYSFNR